MHSNPALASSPSIAPSHFGFFSGNGNFPSQILLRNSSLASARLYRTDHEDVVISKENTKVLSPVAVRCKGRPSSKRKVSKVDQIVQRFKERKKKQHRAMPKAKMDSQKNRAKKVDHDEDMSASRRSMIATEENPNIIFGGSFVDVSNQRSVNLMENQGFLSNVGVMVPRLSLNQL